MSPLVMELAGVQTACLDRYLSVPGKDRLKPFHPDLSPLAWHLGHAAFIETYWIREIVELDDGATCGLHEFYFPETSPKGKRGATLGRHKQLLEWAQSLFEENRARLARLLTKRFGHALLKDGYLPRFLLQHHAQHVETMDMVLAQRQLIRDKHSYVVAEPLQPAAPRLPELEFAAATTSIGHPGGIDAFDNELGRHPVKLASYRIAADPVSNAEYLGFMRAGGYEDHRLWSEDGWAWLRARNVHAPDHWRQDRHGNWYGITARGPESLAGDAPVEGINRHEAGAYAAWTGCRLPREAEWEHACNRPRFATGTGRVWEWCENPFYPYPGYRPFPYERYSQPWFDGLHFTLRGGGRHTHPLLKRPSFRNFYTADKRHVFAGLRLAADS